MQFVLLIYQGTTPALSQAEQQQIYKDYAELNQTPGVTPGLPLGLPTAARVIQVRDGKIEVKNGPHLSEGVAGYLIFEADNIEDATALAARIPAARLGEL